MKPAATPEADTTRPRSTTCFCAVLSEVHRAYLRGLVGNARQRGLASGCRRVAKSLGFLDSRAVMRSQG